MVAVGRAVRVGKNAVHVSRSINRRADSEHKTSMRHGRRRGRDGMSCGTLIISGFIILNRVIVSADQRPSTLPLAATQCSCSALFLDVPLPRFGSGRSRLLVTTVIIFIV